jgi:hypothetical protein
MNRRPQEELKLALGLSDGEPPVDNNRAIQLKRELAEELRQQLTIGAPTNADEAALQRLRQQLLSGKEELDFIINYDIKYRMGDDLFADEDGNDDAEGEGDA